MNHIKLPTRTREVAYVRLRAAIDVRLSRVGVFVTSRSHMTATRPLVVRYRLALIE